MNRLLVVVALVIPLFLFPLVFGSSCPTGAKPWKVGQIISCYTFHANDTDFTTALGTCWYENGDLVSVHEGFTNTFLAQQGKHAFNNGPIVDFWIGLTNMMNPPNWTWSDSSVFDFNNWRENPKKPRNSGSSCGAIAISDGRWNADDCFKSKPYVCKVPNSDQLPQVDTTKPAPLITTTPIRAPTTTKAPTTMPAQATTQAIITTRAPGNCSIGWSYYSNACYLLTPSFDWTTAEEYCTNRSSHLTSIHNFGELNFFNSLENNWKWIGLFSADGTLTWKYTDNSTIDYAPWGNGMPQGFTIPCVHAQTEFHNDITCSNGFKGVCKKLL